MSDDYQRVLIGRGNVETKDLGYQRVQDADLVVVSHPDGRWSVPKDRYREPSPPRPWDELPKNIKRAVSECLAAGE